MSAEELNNELRLARDIRHFIDGANQLVDVVLTVEAESEPTPGRDTYAAGLSAGHTLGRLAGGLQASLRYIDDLIEALEHALESATDAEGDDV